jgi:hypothetical protein
MIDWQSWEIFLSGLGAGILLILGIIKGFARKEWGTEPEIKSVLQPNQTSAEATAVVRFNTEKIISKTITFAFVEHIY